MFRQDTEKIDINENKWYLNVSCRQKMYVLIFFKPILLLFPVFWKWFCMLIIYKEENYVLICSLSWILSTKFDLMLKVLFLVEIDENSLDSCGKKTPIFPYHLFSLMSISMETEMFVDIWILFCCFWYLQINSLVIPYVDHLILCCEF
jgi:hypothetical protein